MAHWISADSLCGVETDHGSSSIPVQGVTRKTRSPVPFGIRACEAKSTPHCESLSLVSIRSFPRRMIRLTGPFWLLLTKQALNNFTLLSTNMEPTRGVLPRENSLPGPSHIPCRQEGTLNERQEYTGFWLHCARTLAKNVRSPDSPKLRGPFLPFVGRGLF